MLNVADLMITSLDTIKAYSMADEPLFVLDELQDATIANTEEKVELIGKQGRKIGSLKNNKAVTISGTSGIYSAGLMEKQVGSAFEEVEGQAVDWQETLTVKDNAAATTYVAAGTAGAEIKALYVLDANNVASTKLEQASSVTEGKFTYTSGTKALAFNTGDLPNGTQITVFYTRNIDAHVLNNYSDHFSEKARLAIDGTAEDKCGTVYRVQFQIPKADFNGNFDIQLGGDQAVQAFEAESLAGGCGVAGGALWTYIVFGANAPDSAAD